MSNTHKFDFYSQPSKQQVANYIAFLQKNDTVRLEGAAEPGNTITGYYPIISESQRENYYEPLLAGVKAITPEKHWHDTDFRLKTATHAGEEYLKVLAQATECAERDRQRFTTAFQKRSETRRTLEQQLTSQRETAAYLTAAWNQAIFAQGLAIPEKVTASALEKVIESGAPSSDAFAGQHGESAPAKKGWFSEVFGKLGFAAYTIVTGTLFGLNLAILTGNFEVSRPAPVIVLAMMVFGSGLLTLFGATMSNVITAIFEAVAPRKSTSGGPARVLLFWCVTILLGVTLGVIMGLMGLATVDMIGLKQLFNERAQEAANRAGEIKAFTNTIPDTLFYLVGCVITLPSTLYKASLAVREVNQRLNECWLASERDNWIRTTKTELTRASLLIPVIDFYNGSVEHLKSEIESLKNADNIASEIEKNILVATVTSKSNAIIASAQFFAAYTRLIDSLPSPATLTLAHPTSKQARNSPDLVVPEPRNGGTLWSRLGAKWATWIRGD
jgi:hypothetical protein